MPSLRDALEAALVEDPDDLATHRAYADYLQEQGDPRGEFIQVQIALEDPQRTETERRNLQARAKELLREHQREWLGILADELFPSDEELARTWPHPIHSPNEHQFARGWLDFLALRDRADFGRRTELGPLLCLAPEARLLRKLVLEYDNGLIDALLASPFLLNLREFQFGRPMSDCEDPPQVVESPLPDLIAKFPRIEELRLFALCFDAPRIFTLPNLSSLRVLQIYYWIVYPLEVLANNAALSNLTHLLLHPPSPPFIGPCIDLGGTRAIVQSPHLRSLTHLQLHRSDLGDVGCTEIVTSGVLKRLKVLDLRHGEITDTGARILADCPDLQRLEQLDIGRNGLTQAGINALRRVLGDRLQADNQQTAEELAQRQYLYDGDFD